MARLNHSNTAVKTELSSSITNTDTSLTVGDATGYPSTPFAIEIEGEVIQVGSKSGTTFSSLTRGYDGTTAASHDAGANVQHSGISEDLEEAYSLLDAVVTAAGTLATSDGSSIVSQSTGSDNDVLITDTAQSNDLNYTDLATLLSNTILTSNGDLLYRNGSGNVVSLGVGNDGQILGSSGSVPQWENKPWEPISTASPSSGSSIDLTGIDSTYEHYQVVVSGLTIDSTGDFEMRFFDGGSIDSTANYAYTKIEPSGADAGGGASSSDTSFFTNLDPVNTPLTGTIDIDRSGGDAGIAWRLGTEDLMSIGFGNHSAMGVLTGIRLITNQQFNGGRATLFGIPHSA